jgi:PAS domain-containing protein
MHALKDLFTSDVGLMSVAVIAFMLGMAVFFIRYSLKHMREEEAATHQRRRQLDALLEQERILAEVEAQTDWHETKSRWEVALGGSVLGVWDWHLDTGMVLLSAQLMAILGEEATQQSMPVTWVFERIHPDDVARAQQARERHFARLAPRYTADYRLRHKGGEHVWVRSRGLVTEWASDGSPIRMIGTLVDMTCEPLLEDRVVELNVGLAP